ncbi:flagellar protein FlaG [Cohnella hashimotonis]|uniref:Flagellar protein FlaG n=1 Tax=Cohnella hashimotonis TaxID=2826895 RepID=A0ABT6TU72_9BACL|nr:flagellar protein FlaG [Cohnella hashimotonis]MDI4650360.1 flagellar protein FlaG [Cohnella hashimotonis]
MDSISLGSASGYTGGVERVPSAQSTEPAAKTEETSSSPDFPSSGDFPSLAALKQAEQSGDQIGISDEQVLKAIEKALKNLAGKTTSLQFSIHEKTKHVMVKVVNSENGEVIREIPPEKNLDFLASLWEKAGILVDERR